MHRKVEHFGPLPLWPFLEHWNWNMEHYQSSSTIFRLYTIVYNNNYTTINKLEYIPKVEVPCASVCYSYSTIVPFCLHAWMPGCLHTVSYSAVHLHNNKQIRIQIPKVEVPCAVYHHCAFLPGCQHAVHLHAMWCGVWWHITF